MSVENHRIWGAGVDGWGARKDRRLNYGEVLSWRRKPKLEELLRKWRGREFQVVGAATAKLREPKHVRTRGTANKLQSDERSLRDGAYCFKTEWR